MYLLSSKECAKRIAKVSAEAKLEIDEETYLSSFKPHLMDVVHTWATGATFAHICKMTDVFEGMGQCLCRHCFLMEGTFGLRVALFVFNKRKFI